MALTDWTGTDAISLIGTETASVYTGTLQEFDGSNLLNVVTGDEIVISDADPTQFSFSQSGSFLSLNEGSGASAKTYRLSLPGALPGQFVFSPDATAGVDLTYVAATSVAPTVAISGGGGTNQALQTIAGTSETAGAGATYVAGTDVTLSDNGKIVATAIVDSHGDWATTVVLPNQGANRLVAQDVDAAGNSGSSAAVTYVLDPVAPTVTVTSPPVSTNQATQTITGSVASGGGATVAGESVTLADNGAYIGAATIGADGSFAAQVNLPDQGANAIVARASDSFGNSGTSAAVTDTLDSVAPTVTITAVTSSTNQATQTITGVVGSGGAASVVGEPVTLTDNGAYIGTATVGGDGSFSAQVNLTGQGGNAILASATDSFGNVGTSAAVTDTLDTAAPTVIITSPAVSTNQATQTISGVVGSGGAATVAGEPVTLTDNGAFIGATTIGGDGSFAVQVNLTDQGTNAIVASTTDSVGNVGTSSALTDTLDSAAPVINITSPAESSTEANQTITGSVASGGAATVAGQQITLTDNGAVLGSAEVDGSGNWAVAATLPSLGDNVLQASVEDSFGNPATSDPVTDSLEASVSAPSNQTTAPVLPAIAFDPTVTFSSPTKVTMTGSASDDAGVTNVEIFQGSTDLGAATLNGDGTFTFTHNFGQGFHAGLTGVATDAAGNSATAPTDFDLTTGIKNSPFTSEIDNYDGSGNYLGFSQYKKNGQLYLSATASTLSDGDQDVLYSSGSFFDPLNYYAYEDVSTPDGNLATETFYNNDGSDDITGYQDHLKITSDHDDTITAGGVHDTFKFKPHFGHDIITDFKVSGGNHDIINLSSSEFSSIAEILQNTKTKGQDAVIHVSNHDTITLENVTKAELQAHLNDFKLHA